MNRKEELEKELIKVAKELFLEHEYNIEDITYLLIDHYLDVDDQKSRRSK